MRNLYIYLVALVVCVAAFGATAAYAQVPPIGNPERTPTPGTDAGEELVDRYRRETPRGTVVGYLRAMAQGDLEKAAKYFDLSRIPEETRGRVATELVRRVQRFLDRRGSILPSNLLSGSRTGQANDGLADNLDSVGSITLSDRTIPVLVERLESDRGSQIWLFSQQMLEQLPQELPDMRGLQIERVLPAILEHTEWNGIPAGHWVAIFALLVGSYAVAWLLVAVSTIAIRYFSKHVAGDRLDGLAQACALPARLYIAVWIFVFAAEHLGISIILRAYFGRVTVIIAGLAVFILLWRLVDVFGAFGERRMTRRGDFGTLSAIMFFRRTAKFVVISVGTIALLDTLGFNVTTGLAAFGIGGIAIALGAQKTIENLVGSLTVIFDQPVRVGDFCKVGDVLGTIEQIGMRSTRIRTLSRTIVTIPNAEFSSQKIENFNHRDRFWFHPILGLRYDTSAEQIRYLIGALRAMLLAQPGVEPDPARVRFLEFGATSLTIEIFAYVRAANYDRFLEIQEQLNLRIAEIVAQSGAGFALPSQTVYLARDRTPSGHIVNRSRMEQ